MKACSPSLHTGGLSLLLVFAAVTACQSNPREERARLGDSSRPAVISEVSVRGQPLDARALASEAAFLFPEESRALIRSLLRAEFAKLEAQRLGLQIDRDELQRAVAENRQGIEDSLGPDQTPDDWALARYGRRWEEFQAVLSRHLASNQLYQLVLRADALMQGRYRIHMLVGRDQSLAESWARKLRSGADPRILAAESMDRGPQGDCSYPPLPLYLPEPLASGLVEATAGAVIGPFQLEGDQAWRVVRLQERLGPRDSLPPRVWLLENLRKEPISALEARAWFEEMLRRYTAREQLPSIQTPASPFVFQSQT